MTFELAHENKSWFLFLILDSFFNFYFFSNLSSSLSVEDLGLGAIDRTSSCQGRNLFILYLSPILGYFLNISFQFDVVNILQLAGYHGFRRMSIGTTWRGGIHSRGVQGDLCPLECFKL